MSGYTMTQPELYYAFSSAGTALTTFTAEASLMGTYPIPAIPATFFNKLGVLTSSMKVRAVGFISSTATPTFNVSLRLLASSTVFGASGLLLGTTTALATASTVTNGIWQLDVDILLRSIAAGGPTSSLVSLGTFAGSAFSGGNGSFPPAGTSPVVSTLDTTGATSYYLWASATCSASSASNSISLQGLKIYLEN